MDRKAFIRNGLLGTGLFVSHASLGRLMDNQIDELQSLEPIQNSNWLGFNHLPLQSSEIMPSMVLHRAESRGHAQHGWLESFHSFSFAQYYNPERMHFGALRVLNDDCVQAGMGFGTHPHDNMEIISIPLEGDLEHRDSMNNLAVIQEGDIQVMSAGKGITHSEYNRNKDRLTRFLQIWVFPNKRDVTPRYDQISLKKEDRKNKLQQILSPSPDDEGVWIHQEAWFHLGRFDNQVSTQYTMKKSGHGVYAFVIEGSFEVQGQLLNRRDALGVWDLSNLSMQALSDNAELLLMEVPMQL